MSDSTSVSAATRRYVEQAQALAKAAWCEGQTPEPSLTVSQWADQHRFLSQKAASEPGRWRTDRTPYLREIMDALSPSSAIQRVVFEKGAQIGATESGLNWIGYVIDQAPGPMLSVAPTVDMAKRYSKQRIAPMIEESPALRDLVEDARSRDSGNTVLAKEFPGGVLVMTGANSAIGLRSMPARYVFLDEVDGYPGDVDGEGDPVALAEARTRTFQRRKIFMVSTPTLAGRSRIDKEFAKSDQRRFFLPCPHCDSYQTLKFEQLKWPKGEAAQASYWCEECGCEIGEQHKTEMLRRGEWRATAESDGRTVGFHLSSMYSPVGWMSWVEIAQRWEAAQGDPDLLKEFINTVLGEVWTERGEHVDWERVYERRETWQQGTLPRGVTILTAAVDVQASPARLELHVWGYGEGLESWAIDRRVFYGPADDPKTWDGVESALQDTWTHASGAELRIDTLGVDTGDQTTAVYGWISKQDQGRIFALKGKKGFEINAPVASPTNIPFGNRTKAVQLRSVTGDVFKSELYRFLTLSRPTDEEFAAGQGWPPGYVHVPDYLDAEWCKQLVAERRVKTKTGRYEWKKEHQANEALDCRVYSRAALWLLGAAGWKSQKWRTLREGRGLDLDPVQRANMLPKPAGFDRFAKMAAKLNNLSNGE